MLSASTTQTLPPGEILFSLQGFPEGSFLAPPPPKQWVLLGSTGSGASLLQLVWASLFRVPQPPRLCFPIVLEQGLKGEIQLRGS